MPNQIYPDQNKLVFDSNLNIPLDRNRWNIPYISNLQYILWTTFSFSIIIFGIIYLINKLTYYLYFRHVSYFNYTIKDKSYNILEKFNNYDRAAEILYRVDNNLITLINKMTKKYKNNHLINPKKYKIIKNIIYKLQKNYKSHSIKENFPQKAGKDVSFNINKGEHISLCLRDFINPDEFHNFNDIMFVAIHELAHSTAISYGHDDEFWYNFKILLEHAIEFNLYTFKDYKNSPVNYCSMSITYTPLNDNMYSDIVYLNKIKK